MYTICCRRDGHTPVCGGSHVYFLNYSLDEQPQIREDSIVTAENSMQWWEPHLVDGANNMENLVYLILIALGLGGLGIFGLFWSIRSSQYSDMDGAANRILYDDEFDSTPKAGAE